MTADEIAAPIAPAPPRFSWPMRLFLGFLLFLIVPHSVMALFPYRDWMVALGAPMFPRSLTSFMEYQDLANAEGDRSLAAERFWVTMDSTWDYWRPWPDAEVRKKLSSWEDYGMFALGWIGSRCDYVEHLLGIQEHWTMFSPSVSDGVGIPRARLFFEDGSSLVVRAVMDPEDITHFSRWLRQKRMDNEKYVFTDSEYRRGYYNFLQHAYQKNQAGSPLDRIYLYNVQYEFPGPGVDLMEAFQAQIGPPDWDEKGPLYVWDPRKKEEESFSKAERLEIQKKLGPAP